jgi:hypothetical protein
MHRTNDILVFGLIGLLAGCATSTPTRTTPAAEQVNVSATLDPSYTLTQQSRVSVFIDENASIEDRRLGAILISQLRTNAFNVVPSPEADFVITCQMEQWTISKGSFAFNDTKLCLLAYAAADLRAGKTKSVWEGRVSPHSATILGYANVVQRHPVSAIRTLLPYFGTDFKGATPLILAPFE